jgi:hypothetical protein
MRHVTYVILFVAWFGTSRAFATPFEPATVPDQAAVVGHLDVDALRRTQLFTAVDGQKAIDTAIDHAPADLRPLAHVLAGSVRGISFWRDTEHGAVYIVTRDPRALAQIVAKAPIKRGAAVDGVATFFVGDHDDHGGHGSARSSATPWSSPTPPTASRARSTRSPARGPASPARASSPRSAAPACSCSSRSAAMRCA